MDALLRAFSQTRALTSASVPERRQADGDFGLAATRGGLTQNHRYILIAEICFGKSLPHVSLAEEVSLAGGTDVSGIPFMPTSTLAVSLHICSAFAF